MIFSLIQDFADALDAMPREHPRYRILKLLDEAIRRDVHFIDRHPTTVFQCLWHNAWWFDCPEGARFYGKTETEPVESSAASRASKLHTLLESWKEAKTDSTPGFWWVRSLTPPAFALESGQNLICRGHRGDVMDVVFSPDGKTIVSAGDNTVRVWDSASGIERLCLQGHKDLVRSVAISPDGRYIVSGSQDSSVRVWDAANGVELRCLCGHTSQVWSVAFDPKSRWLLSAATDHTVRLWDIETGSEIRCLKIESANQAVFSPNGDQFLTGAGNFFATIKDHSIRLWDTASGQQLWGCREAGIVRGLAFSPDGRWVAADNSAKSYSWGLWDASTGQEIPCPLKDAIGVSDLAFTRDSKHLVTASSEPMSSGADETVALWEVSSRRLLHRFRGHEGSVHCVAVSPEGRTIASGGADHTVRVWDIESRTSSRVLGNSGFGNYFTSLAFSPHGDMLAGGTRWGKVFVWYEGRIWEPFQGQDDWIDRLWFSHEAEHILIWSRLKKSIRIVDPFGYLIEEVKGPGLARFEAYILRERQKNQIPHGRTWEVASRNTVRYPI